MRTIALEFWVEFVVSARGTSLRLLQNIRVGVFLEELWDRGKLLRFHSLTLLPVVSLWFLFWKGKMWSISIKFLFLCLHDHNQVYSSKMVCKSKPFPFYFAFDQGMVYQQEKTSQYNVYLYTIYQLSIYPSCICCLLLPTSYHSSTCVSIIHTHSKNFRFIIMMFNE